MHEKYTMLWRPRSRNTKTGDIPQGYIGSTREQTEASCEGCLMRKDTKEPCYYWHGTPRIAHSGMQKAFTRKPDDYSLEYAIRNSVRAARYIRAAVGGDPWVFTRKEVQSWYDRAIKGGFNGVLNYTHFFDTKAKHLKGLAMASCDTLRRADDAVQAGWRSTVTITSERTPDNRRSRLNHIPHWSGQTYETPDGIDVVICPAQVRRTNCNQCGMCDPTRKGPAIIGFLVQ